jgi:hypothetical protein
MSRMACHPSFASCSFACLTLLLHVYANLWFLFHLCIVLQT